MWQAGTQTKPQIKPGPTRRNCGGEQQAGVPLEAGLRRRSCLWYMHIIYLEAGPVSPGSTRCCAAHLLVGRTDCRPVKASGAFSSASTPWLSPCPTRSCARLNPSSAECPHSCQPRALVFHTAMGNWERDAEGHGDRVCGEGQRMEFLWAQWDARAGKQKSPTPLLLDIACGAAPGLHRARCSPCS